MAKDTKHFFNPISVKGLVANGFVGSAGQALLSDGSEVYWGSGAGFTGSKGDTGADGVFGGAAFDYTYSTNTDLADPGDGFLKFNSTNLSTASTLIINDVDDAAVSVYSYLQTIDDSTSAIKGHFTVTEKANTANFTQFSITGAHTHSANSFQVPVAFLAGATSQVNGLDIIITFARTGDRGDIGYAGSTGYVGSKGDIGYTGSRGLIGYTGSVGFTGSKGDIGYAGSKGDIGYAGSLGFTGSASTVAGPQGTQGIIGFTGSQGAGFTGSQGAQGATGPTGPQGVIGYTGSLGAQGAQGITGFYGSTGAQGPLGYTGSLGAQGAQGVIGFTGSLGAQGPQGVIGFTGSKGDIGYAGSRGFTGSVGPQGTQGVIGFTGSQGATGSLGPQGGIGYTGSVGPQGSQGVIGYTGSLGSTGPGGPQGVIGYTGSLGAQGPQGGIGYTGSFGSTGPTGPQGVIGYTGSLGAQGAQGVIGFTGSLGAQGPQGPIGYTGSLGAQGPQGVIGYTGSLGAQGTQGTQGVIGPTGPQGGIGYTGSQGPVAGSNTHVIFNDSGFANGSANFVVNKTTGTVTVRDVGGVSTSTRSLEILNVNQSFGVIPNISSGAYNNMAAAGDIAIVGAGSTIGSANIAIIPWSANSGGIRISTVTNVTSVGVYGNTTITGFANVTSTLQVGANTATFGTAAYIVANGNIGVGTSSPQRPLHAYYNSAVVGAYSAILQGATGGYGAGVSFQSLLTGGALAEMARITADGEAAWDTTAANQDAGLRFYTALNGTVAEKMRITSDGVVLVNRTSSSGYGKLNVDGGADFTGGNVLLGRDSGNVGIGNTAPAHKLSVNGPGYFGDTLWFGSGGYLSWTTGYSDGTTQTFQSPTSGSIALIANGTAGLFIKSNQNVGIGTTTPGYKLEVNGSFAATTKSFVIDHPTKEGMKLRYGSLEGPENGVYVRGRLRAGENIISLPDYWEGLVDQDTYTVNLTPVGKHQELYVKYITDYYIVVGGEEIDCFYTVFAERKDVEKLEVEF